MADGTRGSDDRNEPPDDEAALSASALAERAASSSGGSLPSPLPRVPSAHAFNRVDFRFRVPHPKSRADHTYGVSVK